LSLVRFFKPENRLAKIIAEPGGKHVIAAIDDANAQLLDMSEECLKKVDDALARIYASGTKAPEGAEITKLYTSVREIAGLAALCDLLDLGSAALSVCVLLDHAQNGARLTDEHVAVSLNVLRILRHPHLIDDKGRRNLLRNLDVMVEKSSPKDAALSA
jgi:hypothetical protein